MKELQQIVDLFELPQLTANILPANDKHIPSPGCHKLAYLEIKDEITTSYSLSLGIGSRFIHEAIGRALYKHELYKAIQKYRVRKEE